MNNNKKIINVPGVGNDGKFTDPRDIRALEKFLKAEEEGREVRIATVDLSKQEKLPREGVVGVGNKDVTIPLPENQTISNPSTEYPKLEDTNELEGEISKIDLEVPKTKKGNIKLEYLEGTGDIKKGDISKEMLKIPTTPVLNINEDPLNIPTNTNKDNSPNTESEKLRIENSKQPSQLVEELHIDKKPNPNLGISEINVEEKNLGVDQVKLAVEEKDLKTDRVDLGVEEKELKTDKINLSIEEKSLSTDQVKLETDEKKLSTNQVKLSVEEKDLSTNQVKLAVEEKDLKTDKVELGIEEKELKIDKINLSIEEKDLSTDQVKLAVEESDLGVDVVKLNVERENEGAIERIELQDEQNNDPSINSYGIPENTNPELSLDDLLTSVSIEDSSELPEDSNKKIIIPEGEIQETPQLDKKLIKDYLGYPESGFFKYQLPEDTYVSDGEHEHSYYDMNEEITEAPYDSVLEVPMSKNIYYYNKGLQDVIHRESIPVDNYTGTKDRPHDFLPIDTDIEWENQDRDEDGVNDLTEIEKYYNSVLKFAKELGIKYKLGIADKIAAAISSLAPPINEDDRERKYPSMSDIAGYKERLNSIKRIMNESLKTRYKIADYKLPEFDIDYSLNPSNYLRYLAEKSLPIKSSNPNTLVNLSTVRKTLLDEALSLLLTARDMLERTTKVNRDRLPGGGTSALATDIAQNGLSLSTVSSAISAVVSPAPEVRFPINRPPEDGKTVGWEDGNKYVLGAGNTDDSTYKERLKSYVTGSSGQIDYKFEDKYLKGGGINLTLTELCGVEASEVKSVEALKEILSNGSVYTTAKKMTTTKPGHFYTMTLDSNSYWEVVLQPYTGELNGGFSFLPDFREINLLNEKISGVMTSYNKWIPVSGFELMKSKLGSKSINLFDGEINIPVSIEFTNELRLNIVDDMFKSWKLYFEKCMEVSVYNSESHYSTYYSTEYADHITAVDKTSVCIAPYKNVSFVCDIYIMTPQSETIKKFSLLVVLKDITEEFAGDIDSGGTDLSVTFSIVGENPPGSDERWWSLHKNSANVKNKQQKNQQDALSSMKSKADSASPPTFSSAGKIIWRA